MLFESACLGGLRRDGSQRGSPEHHGTGHLGHNDGGRPAGDLFGRKGALRASRGKDSWCNCVVSRTVVAESSVIKCSHALRGYPSMLRLPDQPRRTQRMPPLRFDNSARPLKITSKEAIRLVQNQTLLLWRG